MKGFNCACLQSGKFQYWVMRIDSGGRPLLNGIASGNLCDFPSAIKYRAIFIGEEMA
ncbi:hypothetical protein QS306_10050 [Paraburkholderia bonniea]|uniref:hypothetical protein n=1 Tax=Paraburkholderia bonniea TaxID=2152891 RepID=UPI001291D766|nr:hypothetical protein [Paraburkholderia bonniea]WJF89461.1 hypothetical protein QS306_10050 [Paraburkholderia bonniea]WJF92776.1 hypothetical protein QS308_10060 [Paraburkholderia bonniea]